jgi:hypothetical protein
MIFGRMKYFSLLRARHISRHYGSMKNHLLLCQPLILPVLMYSHILEAVHVSHTPKRILRGAPAFSTNTTQSPRPIACAAMSTNPAPVTNVQVSSEGQVAVLQAEIALLDARSKSSMAAVSMPAFRLARLPHHLNHHSTQSVANRSGSSPVSRREVTDAFAMALSSYWKPKFGFTAIEPSL